MYKTLTYITAGTLGFVGTVSEEAAQTVTDTFQSPIFDNPNTYIKGLIVSGVIQIIMKLIDKWADKRKARKSSNGI